VNQFLVPGNGPVPSHWGDGMNVVSAPDWITCRLLGDGGQVSLLMGLTPTFV
jgi:hypothetical protein